MSLPIASMTGFARIEKNIAGVVALCELRAVNQRYLDLNLKLSDNVRFLEQDFRELLKSTLGRGKVEVFFKVTKDVSHVSGLQLNFDLVHQLLEAEKTLNAQFAVSKSLTSGALLKWPGLIVDDVVMDETQLEEVALAVLQDALVDLKAQRIREGERIVEMLQQRLNAIEAQVDLVQERLPEIRHTFREKWEAKLNELSFEIDEDRLAQELLYFAQRSDISEELDRLTAHVAEVRDILNQGGLVGRRLDFMMQEFNREANTLASKSMDEVCTKAGVELKVLIEQMREQIQNLE